MLYTAFRLTMEETHIIRKKLRTFENSDRNFLTSNKLQVQAGVGNIPNSQKSENQDNKDCFWFVMRDLKPANAKEKAFRVLVGKLKDVFTPTIKEVEKVDGKIVLSNGEPKITEKPFINDLLFVFDTYQCVKECVDTIPKLQFRYFKGQGYQKPICIPTKEMEYFRIAVNMTLKSPKYIRPEELKTMDFSKKVRVIGGPLNGCICKLLKRRGASFKRLIVELPGILAVGVDIEPEFIEFV